MPPAPQSSIRLQKILRDMLGVSRRRAEEMIAKGRVSVNGKIATLGEKADPKRDRIIVDGKAIPAEDKKAKTTTIVLHKPAGCVTTRRDPHGRKTVYDYLPQDFRRLFSVGRLDYETRGILLFTDNGDLGYRLTHPKFEVEKEYEVTLDRELDKAGIGKVERGINTVEITSAPAKLRPLDASMKRWSLTIHEGKNREVRRIFQTLGYQVKELLRLRFASVKLGQLPKGNWRMLTSAEHAKLESIARETKGTYAASGSR